MIILPNAFLTFKRILVYDYYETSFNLVVTFKIIIIFCFLLSSLFFSMIL